jgi:hypothetical protein
LWGDDEWSAGAMLNYVGNFAGVPKPGTEFAQIFTSHFATIASPQRRCSKGPMDDTRQHGYRFANASMTESCRVEMGPLPLLVDRAWGKEPN